MIMQIKVLPIKMMLCKRRNIKRNLLLLVGGAFILCILTNIIVANLFHRRRKTPNFMHTYLHHKTLNLAYDPNVQGFAYPGSNATFQAATQACVHPSLPLWGPEVDNYIKPLQPIQCTKDKNWVYTRNGRFYISEMATQIHGDIRCAYTPIINFNDSIKALTPIVPMLNNSVLVSDAFKVSCQSSNGEKYANIHACIAPTKPRMQPVNHTYKGFNVLIFGFDSLSRNMFKRFLPKTHKYFTETMGGSILEDYNILGDGTVEALMPMLTGKRELDVPEVRKRKHGAKHVDELVEFVWTKYERKGYVTQWGEDMADVGTFNYRLLGFKNQPVNHYMRPYYLAAIPLNRYFKKYCFGSKSRHEVYLDWLREGFDSYKDRNFFTFGFFSEFTHDNNNPVRLADDGNVAFLQELSDKGIFENTFVFVMSDHGVRYGSIRQTELGKLEERMPYHGIFAPKVFRDKFPEKYAALVTNTKRLVVPHDIHKTLLDIIDENNDDDETYPKSYTLFTEIPRERTCKNAGIAPHWCACLETKPVSISNTNVISSVNLVLSNINVLLEPVRDYCHRLSLGNIIKAVSMETNAQVLKFKKTVDLDGRIPDLTGDTSPQILHFQVTFQTLPNGGIYEATTLVDLKTSQISASEADISRLNQYRDDPKCIREEYPALRPYCKCK